MKIPWECAAPTNLVHELEASAPGMGESSNQVSPYCPLTAGLLLVFTLDLRGSLDGLFIRYFRLAKLHLNTEFPLPSSPQRTSIWIWPMPENKEFLGLFISRIVDRRVLLHETLERGVELVFIAL